MKKSVHLHCRPGSVRGRRVIHHLLHFISRPVRVLTKYHIVFFWTRRQRYKTVTWPRRFSHPISNQCIWINAVDHIQMTITDVCATERIAVWKKDWKSDMRRLGYLAKKDEKVHKWIWNGLFKCEVARYICSNSQQYIVWAKIIDFSFMPKIIAISSKDSVQWKNIVNFLP